MAAGALALGSKSAAVAKGAGGVKTLLGLTAAGGLPKEWIMQHHRTWYCMAYDERGSKRNCFDRFSVICGMVFSMYW